jgi:hypothetical protein
MDTSKIDQPVMNAWDVELNQLIHQSNDHCNIMTLVGRQLEPGFKFNIATHQRTYSEPKVQDLCTNLLVQNDEQDDLDDFGKMIKHYMEYCEAVPLTDYQVDPDTAVMFLEDIKKVVNKDNSLHYKSGLNYNGVSSQVKFKYLGDLNTEEGGHFEGQAVLKIIHDYDSKIDDSRSDDSLSDDSKKADISRIIGTFNKDGVLQGQVLIYSKSNDQVTFAHATNGIIHSVVITKGLKELYDNPRDLNHININTLDHIRQKGLALITTYVNGHQQGLSWIGLVQDSTWPHGFLYGNMDPNNAGKITGHQAAYIYSDFKTALVGYFEDNYMKDAQVAQISSVSCENQILKVDFTQPSGPHFKYDPSSSDSLGELMSVPDPYEARTVIVKQSTIPEAGEGLFATRIIRKGDLVSLFSGSVSTKPEQDELSMKCQTALRNKVPNPKRTCTKYIITTMLGTNIDIPFEVEKMLLYKATSGWKVNNNFAPYANAKFGSMEHPRTGMMANLVALKDIARDEEIFVDYGYSEEVKDIFHWYFNHKKFHEDTIIKNLLKSKRTDLCHIGSAAIKGEGPLEASEAISAYFSNIETVPEDYQSVPIDEKIATRLLTEIEPIESGANLFEAILNLHEPFAISFKYVGDYDNANQLSGFAILKISPKADCFRGVCKEGKHGQLMGEFVNGVLQGKVRLTTVDENQITYVSVKDGVVHGMVITFGISTQYQYNVGYHITNHKNNPTGNLKQRGVAEVSRFLNGKQVGQVWYGLLGYPSATQGYLYGQLDKKGRLTGNNIAYIYPRGKMALVGRFEDMYMKSGQKADIIKVTCKDNVLNVEFSKPVPEVPSFHFDLPSRESFGSMPLFPDPYEESTVMVKTSTIPNAGHGLFAKRNISPNEVVAFYTGMQFTKDEELDYDKTCKANNGGDLMARQKCHKYKIMTYMGAMIIIPPEWDDLNLYNATLGHKVNNKFAPEINANFGQMEHPRFGAIVMVYATKIITEGEEILLDYEYPFSRLAKELAPWYFEQLKIAKMSTSTAMP